MTGASARMRRWARSSVLAALLCSGTAVAQQGAETGVRLMLVASSRSPVSMIDPAEVRRLFLGVPVSVNGSNLTPLRYTERNAQEIFLQRVLFMSLNSYERQIVSHTFRSGRPKPEEGANVAQVRDALLANPAAISYLPEDEARKTPGLKIIGEL